MFKMQRYTHELKINPQYFNQVRIGAKKAEFRRADRDFQVGDILVLREFNAIPPREFRHLFHYGEYTGNIIRAVITDITCINSIIPELGDKPKFVMLSFSILEGDE